CDRWRMSLWYRPSSADASAPMSPKRSKIANVSPLLSTCGCVSVCASVASTYQASPCWILRFFMSGDEAVVLGHEPAVQREVVARHHLGGEAPLEHLAARGAVDLADAAR